jgi:hypothetical protein
MARFLYLFGYEDPNTASANASTGSDSESSAGFLIEADVEAEALRWGREVSQNFVAWLFARDQKPDPDWASLNFAHWLEPEASEAWAAFRDAPVCRVGQLPPFESLL